MANDLSARSDRALRRAVSLAKEFDAELEVVTVIDEMLLEASTSKNKLLAEQALTAQLSAVPDGDGVRASQRVMVGLDYEDIIRRSVEFDADLVVLGIHRHKTKELFRGTTAERVVRYGVRPVLVVNDTVTGPYRRVVVASDLSAHAEAAARTAARLVPLGEVILVHAVHRPYVAFLGRGDQNSLMAEHRNEVAATLHEMIDRLSAELGNRTPKFELSLPEGEVHGAIQAEVAKYKPDLLAVGTHGRTGIAHTVIGSIAEQVLADCPIDVLAVKCD
ncbi:MAG: hypothetical protein APF80_04355 [Alphaproteobacteria bacterium BRH_c36]|nr:MAG: hypothetical protein APF80_04355 [Alphaproteobacteria bacterium BRH_c36]